MLLKYILPLLSIDRKLDLTNSITITSYQNTDFTICYRDIKIYHDNEWVPGVSLEVIKRIIHIIFKKFDYITVDEMEVYNDEYTKFQRVAWVGTQL